MFANNARKVTAVKKRYSLENLGCANCAAHMEEDIAKLDGVNSVKIAFMTQKMSLDVDDASMQSVLQDAQRIVTSYEKDCRIVQ